MEVSLLESSADSHTPYSLDPQEARKLSMYSSLDLREERVIAVTSRAMTSWPGPPKRTVSAIDCHYALSAGPLLMNDSIELAQRRNERENSVRKLGEGRGRDVHFLFEVPCVVSSFMCVLVLDGGMLWW